MQNTKPEKPGRPFGVTIAIVVSIFVYSLIPLAQVALILRAEQFFNEQSDAFTIPYGEDEFEASETGGSIEDNTIDPLFLVQIGLSLGFIAIAFMAWRGSPLSRIVFIGMVLLMTAFSLALIIGPQLQNNQQSSGGSLDGLLASLQVGQITLLILVPVYVIWYLNRAPARAFYRGYYLEAPAAEESRTEQEKTGA